MTAEAIWRGVEMHEKAEWPESWRRFGVPSTGAISFSMELVGEERLDFVVSVYCRLGVGIAYDRTKYTVNRSTGCRIQNEFGIRLEEEDAMTAARNFFDGLSKAERRRILDAIAVRERVPRVKGDDRSANYSDTFCTQRFVDAIVIAAMKTDASKQLRARLHDRYALAVIERDISGPVGVVLAAIGARPSRFLSAGPIKRKELLEAICAQALRLLDGWEDHWNSAYHAARDAVSAAREGKLDVAIAELRKIEANERDRERIECIVAALGGSSTQ